MSSGPARSPAAPHWEHGWRCHGFWLGGRRVGYIGLTPPGQKPVYSWSLDWPRDSVAKGVEGDLRAAKRLVEGHYRDQLRLLFPDPGGGLARAYLTLLASGPTRTPDLGWKLWGGEQAAPPSGAASRDRNKFCLPAARLLRGLERLRLAQCYAAGKSLLWETF